MHFSFLEVASASLLMAGLAAAGPTAAPLATITPCPAAPTSLGFLPYNVTAQHQPISTCSPTSRCFKGTCSTRFPFNTFAFVSSTIPCHWNGTAATSTLVTSTDQAITVGDLVTTLTSYLPLATGTAARNGSYFWNATRPAPVPVYQTVAKQYVAPYNQIGGLGIPGYPGSGFCTSCDPQADGSRSQVVNVTECRSGSGYSAGPQCIKYLETWISKPAPSTTQATTFPVSTSIVARATGPITFTFPRVAPASTFSAGGSRITADPSPYYVFVTDHCTAPGQTIDFTTTITTTITRTVPCSISPPTSTSRIPFPTGGFPGFPRPSGSSAPPAPPAPTTPPTDPAPTSGDLFYIVIYDTSARYHKQTAEFVGFAGGDAVVVGDKSSATLFRYSNGALIVNSDNGFVGADGTTGYAPLEESSSPPQTDLWSRSGDGGLSLNGGHGFCITPDGNIFCLLSGPPSFNCKSVALAPEGSTPTSTTTLISTSTTTTTSQTPDVSGDLNLEPRPTRRAVSFNQFKRHIAHKHY